MADQSLQVNSVALDHRLEDKDVRATKFLLCFLLAHLVVSVSQAQWPTTTSPCNGRFWMETGVSIFDRPGSDLGLPLVWNDITNDVLIDSDSATDLNGALGPNIRIGSRNRWGTDWEAGMTYGKWSIEQIALGPDLASPFIPVTLDPDDVAMGYDSEMLDLQLNVRKAIMPGLTVLIGPRYMYLREDLDFRSSTTFNVVGVGNVLFDTQNDIITRNSAFGGTIGLELNSPMNRYIYFNGYGKASGMANMATLERRSITTTDPLLTQNDDKGTGMFIGQLGGRVYFNLVPQAVQGYVGYEATVVDGVATAPSQALTTGITEVKTTNSIFWHSYNFGLKFTY
ncbi:MAG: hypothetical protein R3C03_00875 [Pirellulaceae bacterium]